jgi:hypothetical protein
LPWSAWWSSFSCSRLSSPNFLASFRNKESPCRG